MPRYIYPPRPKSKIKPDQLPFMEKQGRYLWQPKFDGDRCVTAVDDGVAYLGNRHGRWHPRSSFSAIQHELLAQKNLPSQCYLDGELIKHDGQPRLVLFDVLFWKKYLIGVNQPKRLEILDSFAGNPHPDLPVRCISDHLWIANNGNSDFQAAYSEFVPHELLEGLVLRESDSKLTNWGASEYTVNWQIRCRRSHKNYRF